MRREDILPLTVLLLFLAFVGGMSFYGATLENERTHHDAAIRADYYKRHGYDIEAHEVAAGCYPLKQGEEPPLPIGKFLVRLEKP